MNRVFKLLLAVSMGLVISASATHGLDTSLRILSFESDNTLHENGSVDVTETLRVRFETPRHGIFRKIPTSYQRDGFHRVRASVKDISVTDEEGNSYPVSLSGGNPRVIKIGDPDEFVQGELTYVIRYTIENAFLYFDDHDEWYWNITGTEWDIPIDQVGATVRLPFITDQPLQNACFTGPLGSQESRCGISVGKQSVRFSSNDFLTVVVGWPKGLTPEPTQAQKIAKFFGDNWEYGIPIIVLIAMGIRWYRHGRDPQGHPAIPVQYLPPKDLTPVEIGCLLNFRVSRRDIAAEIVSLASRGYLTIKETETSGLLRKHVDYELTKAKSWQDDHSLAEHQLTILNGLFASGMETVKLSALKTKLSPEFEKISKQITQKLTDQGYFVQDPAKARMWYIALGIGFIFLSLVLFEGKASLITALSAVSILVFGSFMPRRTEKGVQALEYVKGLREYIQRAEKYRLEFQETENTFFDLMPYAMVFGVVEKWADAFKDTTLRPPQWYQGNGPFIPSHFSQSMNGFASAAVAAASPKGSSFSGGGSGFSGGFSGGGGGGGGGGGW